MLSRIVPCVELSIVSYTDSFEKILITTSRFGLKGHSLPNRKLRPLTQLLSFRHSSHIPRFATIIGNWLTEWSHCNTVVLLVHKNMRVTLIQSALSVSSFNWETSKAARNLFCATLALLNMDAISVFGAWKFRALWTQQRKTHLVSYPQKHVAHNNQMDYWSSTGEWIFLLWQTGLNATHWIASVALLARDCLILAELFAKCP